MTKKSQIRATISTAEIFEIVGDFRRRQVYNQFLKKNGIGVSYDKLEKAADEGCIHSQYILAETYYRCRSSDKRDRDKALYYASAAKETLDLLMTQDERKESLELDGMYDDLKYLIRVFNPYALEEEADVISPETNPTLKASSKRKKNKYEEYLMEHGINVSFDELKSAADAGCIESKCIMAEVLHYSGVRNMGFFDALRYALSARDELDALQSKTDKDMELSERINAILSDMWEPGYRSNSMPSNVKAVVDRYGTFGGNAANTTAFDIAL